jgi:hypothetical protein
MMDAPFGRAGFGCNFVGELPVRRAEVSAVNGQQPAAGKHSENQLMLGSARDHCVAVIDKGHRMKFLRHHRWIRASIAGFIITALSALFAHDSAWSQSRVIKLVIPYPSGGINESMFRVVADQIGRQGGPTFIIEPRPGAGTMIATEAVSRAAPDGNTVLIVGNSFVVQPHLRKLTYDPFTSFEPICYLWQSPQQNTPGEIVERLNKEINAALASPVMKARLADLGSTAFPTSPREFGKFIADETRSGARWSSLRASGRTDPRGRHCRTPSEPMVVGTARPAIHRREPARRWQQYCYVGLEAKRQFLTPLRDALPSPQIYLRENVL